MNTVTTIPLYENSWFKVTHLSDRYLQSLNLKSLLIGSFMTVVVRGAADWLNHRS